MTAELSAKHRFEPQSELIEVTIVLRVRGHVRYTVWEARSQ